MLCLSVSFVAGRYHATPWGRHVNEADVAWPPEPWRLCRALIATWHRKADQVAYPYPVLADLIDALAQEPPEYGLPPAVHAHTRHYMPVYEGAKEAKVLVFDAFLRLPDERRDERRDDARLFIRWPDLSLSSPELALLDHLLERLGYLGRAESWVEIRRESGDPVFRPSHRPTIGDQAPQPMMESRASTKSVKLLAPRSPADYATRRHALLAEMKGGGRKPKERKALEATLPERLVDALTLETSDYHAAGWSLPPAARVVTFETVAAATFAQPRSLHVDTGPRPTVARFVLAGRPLPRLEDALTVGDRAHQAMIRLVDDVVTKNKDPASEGRDAVKAKCMAIMGGHGVARDPRHGHAFYLPEDADGDGRIDHLVVYARDGFDEYCRAALDRFVVLRLKDGLEVRLALEGFGHPQEFGDSDLLKKSRTWISTAPYLRPWHSKPGFGVEEQIRQEVEKRQIGALARVCQCHRTRIAGRSVSSLEFFRFRRRLGHANHPQPDTVGCFWKLTFADPVQGPLALGWDCHYGLGLFRAPDGTSEGSGQ